MKRTKPASPRKVLIFGNSGSGKSTLAKRLCETENLAHLDLDALAWEPTTPPVRKPLDESKARIDRFAQANDGWVIEGCYADLLEMALPQASEIVYMNLPVEACVANARSRPWEPHKYESKSAQDANLSMLIEWIRDYPNREGPLSKAAHRDLYDGYAGQKRMVTSNDSVTSQ